ncbi:hypothetical protein HMPREF0043_01089 [Actinobaculum sp. oral taxon 183 str. F0552]|nr:hypothetical protein HMPREF0043_01089 [Actinobaculum sp. oral taxon 183 str. F0552]
MTCSGVSPSLLTGSAVTGGGRRHVWRSPLPGRTMARYDGVHGLIRREDMPPAGEGI